MANTLLMAVSIIGSTILGLTAAYLVYAVLTDRPFPMVASHRSGFIALAAIGFVMCCITFPIKSNLPNWNWLSPFTLVAMVLGGLAMLLMAAVLLGWRPAFMADDRTAVLILGLIVAAKYLVTQVHNLVG
jgi:hypothetical protein